MLPKVEEVKVEQVTRMNLSGPMEEVGTPLRLRILYLILIGIGTVGLIGVITVCIHLRLKHKASQ